MDGRRRHGDHRLGRLRLLGVCTGGGPNPTQATPIDKVIKDKPIIKVPGCPPIAEVMTGVVTYITTFGRLPELDRQGRPKMFYSQRIHDKCYRRPHFDAGQFVEEWDDEAARKGHCLYKMGCKGPTTYNACSTVRWNGGVSFPIQSGHGCIGCSEEGFWDKGPFYERLSTIRQFGVEKTPTRSAWPPRASSARRWRPTRRLPLSNASWRNAPRPRSSDHPILCRMREGASPLQETQVMGIETPNGFNLDNSGKRVVVDPVTRIEGHLRIEVNVDANNVIRNAVSTGTMWRGIEVILKTATRATLGRSRSGSAASARARMH